MRQWLALQIQVHASSVASLEAQEWGGWCLWAAGSVCSILGPWLWWDGQLLVPQVQLHSPWGFGCGRRAFRATGRAPHGWEVLGVQRPGQLLQENSPNSHQESLFSLFLCEKFLLLKPLLHTRAWHLTQSHFPPRPGTIRVRIGHDPTLPSWHPQSLWVHTAPVCLPLRPYSPP